MVIQSLAMPKQGVFKNLDRWFTFSDVHKRTRATLSKAALPSLCSKFSSYLAQLVTLLGDGGGHSCGSTFMAWITF